MSANRSRPRLRTGRSRSSRTCVRHPLRRRCGPASTRPDDVERSAADRERSAAHYRGTGNLRVGSGPSTSHTPPGGSLHVNDQPMPPTSWPGKSRRVEPPERSPPALCARSGCPPALSVLGEDTLQTGSSFRRPSVGRATAAWPRRLPRHWPHEVGALATINPYPPGHDVSRGRRVGQKVSWAQP